MLKKYLSIIALITAIIFTLYFVFISISMRGETSSIINSINLPVDDTAFGGIFKFDNINDSLPYYRYRTIKDSLDQRFKIVELNNKSISSGMGFGSIGVYSIRKNWEPIFSNHIWKDSISTKIMDSLGKLENKLNETLGPDSINLYKDKREDLLRRYNERLQLVNKQENENDQLYYFGLNNYNIDYDSKFYIQNGTYHLAYVKWEGSKNKYNSGKVGHYESKQIKVRYSSDDKRILIPISRKKYNTISLGLNIFLYLALFFSAYIFIGLPVQILISISKGKAFTEKNVKMFKTMALVLFIITLIEMIVPYILQFSFQNLIPTDFKLSPFLQSFFNNFYLLLISIALFIISKAFQKGLQLQNEQDLTI